MYYVSCIDLISRMINMGKLDGKKENKTDCIYSNPERDKSYARRVT